jgi:hypothetical protein
MEVTNDEMTQITGGPLRPHEYVLVQTVMTAADETVILNQAAKSSGKQDDKQIQYTIGDVQLATVKRMVKGWSLTKTVKHPASGESQEVPILFSVAAIEQLPRPIYRYILKQIDKLNPDDEGEDD